MKIKTWFVISFVAICLAIGAIAELQKVNVDVNVDSNYIGTAKDKDATDLQVQKLVDAGQAKLSSDELEVDKANLQGAMNECLMSNNADLISKCTDSINVIVNEYYKSQEEIIK